MPRSRAQSKNLGRIVENLVMKRDGQHLKPGSMGAGEQFSGGVIDLVERVFGRVQMQIGFDPSER